MSSNENIILLKDILKFDELKKQYPDKRIKLRFNTSWTEQNESGEKLYRDYLKLYKSNNSDDMQFFKDSIMSLGSEKKLRLSERDIVFQFIEIRYHVWLLVDVVNITNQCSIKKGYNKFTQKEFEVAQGERLECYQAFCNRLTVNWKNKPQQFFYVADEIINSVEIREILVNHYLDLDEEFCGYERVSKTYIDLKNVMDKPSWKDALTNVYGVYVLTDSAMGKLYVGSATGERGVYGRWNTYLDSGYDNEESDNKNYPNNQLKNLVEENGIEYIQNNFQYSLLEIFPKNEMGKDKALERESYWKTVLKTREFGYNDN